MKNHFYCPFDTKEKTLGEIGVEHFKIGETVNDFSVIGIIQKLSSREVKRRQISFGF